ncbi:MAG: hypothetical protein HPY60_10880, partial [Candidatus Methanofastidiosum sp.]|nr:hypothetical protein [Methanofastidiosum sp.]
AAIMRLIHTPTCSATVAVTERHFPMIISERLMGIAMRASPVFMIKAGQVLQYAPQHPMCFLEISMSDDTSIL